jgi:hypothetical protein
MERQLLEIEAEIEANNERIGAMDNHMKNVEHEVKVVQVSVCTSRLSRSWILVCHNNMTRPHGSCSTG